MNEERNILFKKLSCLCKALKKELKVYKQKRFKTVLNQVYYRLFLKRISKLYTQTFSLKIIKINYLETFDRDVWEFLLILLDKFVIFYNQTAVFLFSFKLQELIFCNQIDGILYEIVFKGWTWDKGKCERDKPFFVSVWFLWKYQTQCSKNFVGKEGMLYCFKISFIDMKGSFVVHCSSSFVLTKHETWNEIKSYCP